MLWQLHPFEAEVSGPSYFYSSFLFFFYCKFLFFIRYNEGYSVVVRCFTLDDVDKVKAHIEKVLPGSALLQVNYIQMRFRLAPDTSLGLAFRVLNQAKNDKLIQDYSLSQTTLESVSMHKGKQNLLS